MNRYLDKAIENAVRNLTPLGQADNGVNRLIVGQAVAKAVRICARTMMDMGPSDNGRFYAQLLRSLLKDAPKASAQFFEPEEDT